MGRAKLPTNVLKFRGKSHMGKEEFEERQNSEIKANNNKVKAPPYLPKELKSDFNKIAKELKEIDIITNLDIDALARFIIAKKIYIEITNKILEEPEIVLSDEKILNAQDKMFKQCRQSASDLGLTITSRCKLVIPTSNRNTIEKTEEEMLFGGSL